MAKRAKPASREEACDVCKSFCSHVDKDDPGACKEIFEKFRKQELTDDQFATAMTARYGRDWERLMAEALGLEFRER